MTQITCDLYDSNGNPLVGAVRVSLAYPVTDEGTRKIYLPVPVRVPLVNGKCTLTLEQSELARVSYLFEILETITITEDGISTQVDQTVDSFNALVPESSEPLPLADLRPTGVTRDALATALVTITRRLYNDDDFWAALQQQIFRLRGIWTAINYYQIGDIVFYQGSSYMCKSPISINAVLPTEELFWQQIAQKGDTGSGISGSDVPYDPNGWNGNTDAPSKNAVRDVIETLAKKSDIPTNIALLDSPSFTGNITVPLAPLNDNTGRPANTQWVQRELALIKQPTSTVPFGAMMAFAGSVAPQKWLFCDGRPVSKTTYADLFAAIGTQYNTGGEASDQFRLPDLRSRVAVGKDNSVVSGDSNRISASWVDNLGGTGGTESVTLTKAQLPAHTHNATLAVFNQGNGQNGFGSQLNPFTWDNTGETKNVSNTMNNGKNFSYLTVNTAIYSPNNYQYAYGDYYPQNANASTYSPIQIFNTGTGSPHDNIQPSIALNYIIYSGV